MLQAEMHEPLKRGCVQMLIVFPALEVESSKWL